MLIVGCSGHAKETLDVLLSNDFSEEIVFFDNITKNLPKLLYQKYQILTSFEEASEYFKTDNSFILGIGGVKIRAILFQKFIEIGGRSVCLIPKTAYISSNEVVIEEGVCLMHGVFISAETKIGKGTLLNHGVKIHHNTQIGSFCEIQPGAVITGNCTVGNNVTIGSGAILIPNITIGNNVTIGAGAVVIKNVPENVTIVGVPAKIVSS